MTTTEIKEEERILLKVEGRVDTTNATDFQNAILLSLQKMNNLVIDLSQLEYVSSAGLRAFLLGHKTAASKGGSLTIVGVNDAVRAIFKTTGFDKFLTIEG